MMTPELQLFFGTVSVTAATLGAFSILIYVFWYDKLLERWGRMLKGVRRRKLGAEMQSNGAKEILIDIKNPLHAWKRVVDVTKDPAFPELIMQAALLRGQEMGAEGGEEGILTNRIITNSTCWPGRSGGAVKDGSSGFCCSPPSSRLPGWWLFSRRGFRISCSGRSASSSRSWASGSCSSSSPTASSRNPCRSGRTPGRRRTRCTL